jgi:hypothetical protein
VHAKTNAFQLSIVYKIIFTYFNAVAVVKMFPILPHRSSLCASKLVEMGEVTQPDVASHPFENK